MKFRLVLPVVCLVFLPASAIADEESESEARAEFNRLVDEFEEEGGTTQFAARFFELANRHRSNPVAIDAYAWILRNRRTKADAVRAMEMIEEHHLASPHLNEACERIGRIPSPKAERLLTALMKSNPHETVRARACVELASLLEQQATTIDQLSKNPELKERAAQYYGSHILDLNSQTITGKLERVYQQMDSFRSVSLEGEPLGEIAQRALFRIHNLSVGRVAPEIEGQDILGQPFKLSDFRGKVVVLSFWAHW